MPRYDSDDAEPCDTGLRARWSGAPGLGDTDRGDASAVDPAAGGAAAYLGFGRRPSALLTVVGTLERALPEDGFDAICGPEADRELDRDRCEDPELGGAAGALRSWVVGWTHRLDPLGARRTPDQPPAGVRRLVEAVVDVLLERRPAEQVKRWVSREVFGLLSTVTQRRAVTRFAARSMVRSIRLHAPGPDAVESTVLVQDGPRVRAVALRFERTAQDRLEWRCTALQFA
ncbi:MAG TPA: Rv3235 family protein [Actinocrinis sp.]|nr:Rv3235 family protein [Actinocrinis sp.]